MNQENSVSPRGVVNQTKGRTSKQDYEISNTGFGLVSEDKIDSTLQKKITNED